MNIHQQQQAVTGRLREVMPKLYSGVNADRLTFSSNRAFETNNGKRIKGMDKFLGKNKATIFEQSFSKKRKWENN